MIGSGVGLVDSDWSTVFGAWCEVADNDWLEVACS